MTQNEMDAYRYMMPAPMGTARSLGLAGAFSAVGADFSSTTSNPAGLALYRRSDFMFTPALRLIGNSTTYLDQNAATPYSRFGFSNLGYVYSDRITEWNRQSQAREEAEKGLKSYAFSFGFNQGGQLGRSTSISAYNPKSSITQYFASLANGYTPYELNMDNSYAGLAWQAYAIDSSGPSGNYIGAANGGNVQQSYTQFESGRMNEWTMGFAANVDDKLYFGGTVGIQGLKYQSDMVFEESDIHNLHNSWANDSTPYTSSTFTNGFVSKGSGLNLRVGCIAKPADFVRIGLNVMTPTLLSMTDQYYSEIVGYLDGDPNPYQKNDVPEGYFSYNLTTPFKVTLGTAFLFGKKGFISGDLDYTDYSTARYKTSARPGSSSYYSFRTENQTMRSIFSSAVNARIGGELRFGPGRIRAGYGFYGSILRKDYRSYLDYGTNAVKTLPGGKQLFSLGLGIKQKSFYIDAAFTHEESADRRLLYSLQDVSSYSPELINRISSNNIYMTIGFTF
ncbi:MAG: hypothetical protein RLZZ165_182 [Bacteroidota bacterium]|jgi:hypothetical protein